MKLKRLDLHGFKSFSEPTSFSYQDGITSVVGPNGCGKSNIVDAIRWCMGEQSARHLRGDGMEDVIFNGSIQRRPLGMAEVSLTFTVVPGDVLPKHYSGFSELMITRRLFRSGESEYFINKVPCRHRDITDLFLDTGIGTRAYSIVEQGQVGAIIGARPEERRLIIEEAAGIRKYKERKKEALRHMEVSQTNLQRVSDILVELEKQINSLHRQAKKAERYKNLKEEVKRIDVAMSWLKYRGLSTTFHQNEETERTLRSQEKILGDEIQAIETVIIRLKDSLREEEGALVRAREEVFRLQNFIQEKEKDLAILDAREGSLKDEVARIRGEKDNMAEQHEEIMRTLNDKIEALKTLEEGVAAMEKDILGKDARVSAMEGNASAMAETMEKDKAAIVECLTAMAHVKNDVTHSEKILQECDRKLEFLKSKVEEIDRILEVLRTNIKGAEEKLSEHTRKKESVQEELSVLDGRRKDIERNISEADEELGRLSVDLATEKERLSSLKEKGIFSGSDGILEVLTSNGRNGILGRVGEIFDVDPRYRHALEAVLGDKFRHLIVKTSHEGVQAVEYLKERSAGRGSFVPVEIALSEGSYQASGFPGGHGQIHDMSNGAVNVDMIPLIGLVKVKEDFQAIAQHLLRGAYIVQNLKDALELLKRAGSPNGFSYIFVTPDGDYIDQHGIVTGGSRMHIGSKELLALEGSIREKSGRVETIAKDQETLKKDLAAQDALRKALEDDLRQCEEYLIEDRKVMTEIGAEIDHLLRERESRTAEDMVSREEREVSRRNLDQTRLRLESLEKEKFEREAALSDNTKERERISAELVTVGSSLVELKVSASREHERTESVRREVDDLKKRAIPLDQILMTHQKNLEEREGALLTCVKDRQAITSNKEELQSALTTAQDTRGKFEEVVKQRDDDIAKNETVIRDKRKELEDVHARLGTLTLQIQESRLTLSHLEESVMEKYQVALSGMTDVILEDLPPEEEREQVLEELKRKIEGMGEVNMLALDEYSEVKQRHELMSAQKDDLLHSMEDLHSIIQKLNTSYREKFSEMFQKVNSKFMEVLPRLFQGGRAELKIVGEQDLQECGIEIVVQPPGKRLQSITLLSGGEKALTAVALIFAIFLIKPTPFCLLDEVDAPLDDMNIGRFVRMVKELSLTSQFIIITHNKKTMEAGQILYGITMQEPGVSTIVSVKLN